MISSSGLEVRRNRLGIQGVVQAALNHPVTSFELRQAPSLQLLRTQAAHQIDDFAAPRALTFGAGLQPGDSRCWNGCRGSAPAQHEGRVRISELFGHRFRPQFGRSLRS